MLKRIVLGILVATSLLWIGIVGYDIFSAGNEFNERYLFDARDGQVLIINRSHEVQLNEIEHFNESPFYDLIENLHDSTYDQLFVSFLRPHLLVKHKSGWTPAKVDALFALSGTPVKHHGNGKFSWGNYTGRYKKTDLYVSPPNYTINQEKSAEFKFDERASASIVSFKESSEAWLTDVYFKSGGKIDFITHESGLTHGNQVRDAELFSSILSSKIDNYHFLERDYYAGIDSVYANGPMFQWMHYGFVEFEYKGERAIVCDYVDGQDPILILNDLIQSFDATYFKTPLTDHFPSKGNGYYVKYLEDLVVISEKETVCDQLIADYKLGSTIALNAAKRQAIYGRLPKSVSDRKIDKDQAYSKSVYNTYLLETHLIEVSAEQKQSCEETMALACNFDIQDFAVLSGTGNAVVLGKKGEVVLFRNGKQSWKKTLPSNAVGGVQVIDLHDNGENHVLLNTEDEIFAWNLSGEAITGFPIKLEQEATNEVKFYRWKGNSYFIIACANNVYQFDAKGRELSIFKTDQPITQRMNVWASQGNLYAGLRSQESFSMLSFSSKKIYRTFEVPSGALSGKVPNQLVHYACDAGNFSKTDQKGTKTNLHTYPNGKILRVQESRNNPTVLLQSTNDVHILNQEGVPFGKIRLPFNEIGDIFYYASNTGKTRIAVLDGLENNVYLYKLNGEFASRQPMEGSKKVVLSETSDGLVITTIVDQFVVQYIEN